MPGPSARAFAATGFNLRKHSCGIGPYIKAATESCEAMPIRHERRDENPDGSRPAARPEPTVT